MTEQVVFHLFRWIHFLAGVTWIGLLYYFNFVQGAFMAQAQPAAKSEVTEKLLPRALWWFRWGAMVTWLSGLVMLLLNHLSIGPGYWSTARGVYIFIGALLGTIMWFNVWFIIWPNQKVIIANKADPAKVGNRPRVAFLASRTNTMLSIPMLYFMGSSAHGPWVF